jgi:hypothetical protein
VWILHRPLARLKTRSSGVTHPSDSARCGFRKLMLVSDPVFHLVEPSLSPELINFEEIPE